MNHASAPTPTRPQRRRAPRLAAASVLAATALLLAGRAAAGDDALPARLSGTGLFAPGAADTLRPGLVGFSPQYPLWSDGADKQRWMALPPGSAIDASMPDAWDFPPGTRLWKTFSHGGRPVETRTMQRLADGRWRYATYLWDADGRDATLAPRAGVAAWPVAAAPGGRYPVPGRDDCLACHEGAAVPVLGATALQLSPDRDPLAVHGGAPRDGDADLRSLVERGLLRGLPASLLTRPPRIEAESPTERVALGYLHANCGHCHNRSGAQVPLRLTLAQSAADPAASRDATLRSVAEGTGRYRLPDAPAGSLIAVPGKPGSSLLALRMASRQAQRQMPPLGTAVPDTEGLALVRRWITDHLSHPKEP